MKTIRVFISSLGDVAEERKKVKQVIAQVQARYAGEAELDASFVDFLEVFL